MKALPLALALVLASLVLVPSFAQKKSMGYVMTDSALFQGIVKNIGKGRIEHRRAPGTTPLVYNEIQIKEYSTGRNTYEALTVNGERNFYERLVTGNTNLYQRDGRFVLKKENNVVPLDKKDFRTTVTSVISCEGTDKTYSNLTYSKVSLKHVVKKSNDGKCSLDAIPYRKLGIYAGYNTLNYRVSDTYNNAKTVTSVPTIGIFFDAPSYRAPFLYFSADVNWLSARPVLYNASGQNTYYVGLRVNQINTNLGLKLVAGHGRIRPYFKVGGFTAFGNITSPDGVILTTMTGLTVEITRTELPGKGIGVFGFQTGAGFEIKLKQRKNLHLEARYIDAANRVINTYDVKYSNLCFNVGINF